MATLLERYDEADEGDMVHVRGVYVLRKLYV